VKFGFSPLRKINVRRALRRILGPKRGEQEKVGENCVMRSFIICTLHHILLM
jgi:hypothetical protein